MAPRRKSDATNDNTNPTDDRERPRSSSFAAQSSPTNIPRLERWGARIGVAARNALTLLDTPPDQISAFTPPFVPRGYFTYNPPASRAGDLALPLTHLPATSPFALATPPRAPATSPRALAISPLALATSPRGPVTSPLAPATSPPALVDTTRRDRPGASTENRARTASMVARIPQAFPWGSETDIPSAREYIPTAIRNTAARMRASTHPSSRIPGPSSSQNTPSQRRAVTAPVQAPIPAPIPAATEHTPAEPDHDYRKLVMIDVLPGCRYMEPTGPVKGIEIILIVDNSPATPSLYWQRVLGLVAYVASTLRGPQDLIAVMASFFVPPGSRAATPTGPRGITRTDEPAPVMLQRFEKPDVASIVAAVNGIKDDFDASNVERVERYDLSPCLFNAAQLANSQFVYPALAWKLRVRVVLVTADEERFLKKGVYGLKVYCITPVSGWALDAPWLE